MLNIEFNFLKKNKFFLNYNLNDLNYNKNFNFFNYIILLNNKIFLFYKKYNISIKEKYIRCWAEFENYKKKSLDDISKSYKYSIEDFSENLLPVIDSLESTLNNKFYEKEEILEGLRLTLKIFINILNKKNIKFILPNIKEKFDPYKHLAISTLSCVNMQDNVIANVLQKGYNISERILRPALVVVNKV
ncbi:Heat shock protein GrpE [Candidatus Nasuia deltocephalinicola]|uniref:Protein GrpE n=1 Tax=Candidatus Nasuia deltocephalincola TaxID=1160784 RepID=A0A7G6UHT8_9PROT|nr:Heat shock protein GrpE [Candidatus Nasuia deltocephalinicola]